jgi:hypothetical protein
MRDRHPLAIALDDIVSRSLAKQTARIVFALRNRRHRGFNRLRMPDSRVEWPPRIVEFDLAQIPRHGPNLTAEADHVA